MDPDLIESTSAFSPCILNSGNRITPKTTVLSLKKRQVDAEMPPQQPPVAAEPAPQPRPPPRRGRTPQVRPEEPQQPTTSRSRTSQSSGEAVCTTCGKENCWSCKCERRDMPPPPPPPFPPPTLLVDPLISEDESARSERSEQTYVTCCTSQPTPREESNEEMLVESLQSSLAGLALTPVKKPGTVNVGSPHEKVEKWLEELGQELVEPPAAGASLSQPSSCAESARRSSTQSTSATTYRRTDSSSQYFVDRPPWSENYNADQPAQPKRPIKLINKFNESLLSPDADASLSQPSSSQQSSQPRESSAAGASLSQPSSRAESARRGSTQSTSASSVATTQRTDYSSQYFVERPPWSKNYNADQPAQPKKTIELVNQFNTFSESVSDDGNESVEDDRIVTGATVPSSPETDESLHLQYDGESAPPQDHSNNSSAPLANLSTSYSPILLESSINNGRQQENREKSPTQAGSTFSFPLHSRDEVKAIVEEAEGAATCEQDSEPSTWTSIETVPWPPDLPNPVYPPNYPVRRPRTSAPPRQFTSGQPSTSESRRSSRRRSRDSSEVSEAVDNSLHELGFSRSSAVIPNSHRLSIIDERNISSSIHDGSMEVATRRSISRIIDISDDSTGDIVDLVSSDDDEETDSPIKCFRTHENRPSYVEITETAVTTDEEEEEEEESDLPCSSSARGVIPPSDEDDSYVVQPRRRQGGVPQLESSPEISEDDSAEKDGSPQGSPHFTQEGRRTIEISPSAIRRIDFDQVQITDDEDDTSPPDSPKPSPSPDPSPESPAPRTVKSRCTASPPTRRRHNISSSPSDDDGVQRRWPRGLSLEDSVFQQQRQRQQNLRDLQRHLAENDSPNFIASDHKDSSEDSRSDTESPTFYHRIINEKRKKDDLDHTWQPPSKSTPIIKKPPKANFVTPKPPKPKGRPQIAQTTGRAAAPKQSCLVGEGKQLQFSPCLSFLASLSKDKNHLRRHPEAVKFIDRFNQTKHELTTKLFAMFNDHVFDNKLPRDMSVTWNNRLRSTAGYCYNQRKPQSCGECLRISRIELSTKLLVEPARLRDTLIHEMCHAATWVISGQVGGHGPIWKSWTEKAMRKYRELPRIAVCHSYHIETKYTYVCVECNYSIGRHTNSLDVQRQVCGLCRGRFQVLVRGKQQAAEATPRKPNVFALFVREHYSVVKNGRKSLKHGDVMKMLSQKFAEQKISKKDDPKKPSEGDS